MNKTARSRYILQVLEKNGEIEIDEIVGKCSISAITARRDLEELARQGLLIRTHGGAMRDDSVHQLFSFGRRIDHKREQKPPSAVLPPALWMTTKPCCSIAEPLFSISALFLPKKRISP